MTSYKILNSGPVTRMLIGGVYSYIHVCPTSFFSNLIQINQFERMSAGLNMNK